MLWRFFSWLFWRPRFRYEIVVGTSHASAEEAASSAQLKANAAGGEVIGIAADAMCCAAEEVGGPPTDEWDVYLAIRHP
jgi:hypothetical protein